MTRFSRFMQSPCMRQDCGINRVTLISCLPLHLQNMAAAVRPSTPARLPASLKYLEGANSQSSASWFHPERLYDPDFSVDAYVAELRQSAPLEALNDELDRLLATLKGKVISCKQCGSSTRGHSHILRWNSYHRS